MPSKQKPKSFGDLSLDVVKIEALLDQTLTVFDISSKSGEYGEYAAVTVRIGDSEEEKMLITGAGVVIEKIHRAKQAGLLPLPGKVSRSYTTPTYYDLVAP
tara:strand:+ start:764 stop:1066 length:303 start_codon:yes stop_codon:yes gene_type:complete